MHAKIPTIVSPRVMFDVFAKELNLSSCGYTTEDLINSNLGECNADIVDLSQNYIQSLAGIRFPFTMEDLNVGNNLLETLKDGCFPEGLKCLNADRNNLVTLDDAEFPFGLVELRVFGTQIHSFLSTVHRQPYLDEFGFIRNGLTDEGVCELSRFMQLTRTARLGACGILSLRSAQMFHAHHSAMRKFTRDLCRLLHVFLC